MSRAPAANHSYRFSSALQDLRHCWPLAESQSQRDFRAAMHAWIKALGSAGRLPPDAVRFFPTAYQTACGPRTIELLGALCTLALEAEAERCFPGAVGDLPPDHTDNTALTSGWGLHQAVAEGRRRREASSLSLLLATLQRLQEVWEASAARAGAAGCEPAAEPGQQLWSSSAAHTARVAMLQQVFDSGLLLSDRPDAATGAAIGALLLGERLDLAAGEGTPPSLAGEAPPEGVLQCLQLRLVAAVQRLQGCTSDGVSGSQLQAALTELQQVYGEPALYC